MSDFSVNSIRGCWWLWGLFVGVFWSFYFFGYLFELSTAMLFLICYRLFLIGKLFVGLITVFVLCAVLSCVINGNCEFTCYHCGQVFAKE